MKEAKTGKECVLCTTSNHGDRCDVATWVRAHGEKGKILKARQKKWRNEELKKKFQAAAAKKVASIEN